MTRMVSILRAVAVSLSGISLLTLAAQAQEIKLIVRGDDLEQPGR